MAGQERLTPFEAALGVWRERYACAPVMFLAGSVMRGEATETSDLDIVVVFEKFEELLAPFGGTLFEGFHMDVRLREKLGKDSDE